MTIFHESTRSEHDPEWAATLDRLNRIDNDDAEQRHEARLDAAYTARTEAKDLEHG